MFCEKTSALWPPIFYTYDKVLARICSEVLIGLRPRSILIINFTQTTLGANLFYCIKFDVMGELPTPKYVQTSLTDEANGKIASPHITARVF